jgi:hypothetical protein
MRAAGSTLVGRLRASGAAAARGWGAGPHRRAGDSSFRRSGVVVRMMAGATPSTSTRVLRPLQEGRRKLRGVVFDMDGTLVRRPVPSRVVLSP